MNKWNEKARKFNEENPEVYDMIENLAYEMIENGFSNYSINSLFEVVRWHFDLENSGNEPFKMNNNYRAWYARRFMKLNPEHDGFFRIRKQVGDDE